MSEEQASAQDRQRGQERIVSQLNLLMSGPIRDAFMDPDTIEIMVNPDQRIFCEKLGRDVEEIGVANPSFVMSIIKFVSA